MDIDDFIYFEKSKLDDFRSWYKEMQKKEGDKKYQNNMDCIDWTEEYKLWME